MIKKGLKQAILNSITVMLIVVMSIGILPAKIQAATTEPTEPTIIVGIRGTAPQTKSEFTNKHNGRVINYNGNSYSATDFFDNYNGMEFGITKTTTGKNPSITVTLREGKSESKQIAIPIHTTPQTQSATVQPSLTTTEPSSEQPTTIMVTDEQLQELISNAPSIEETRSSITLTSKRLTETELNAWIAEYEEMGNANAFELEVVRLINIERAKEGLEPLAISQPLMMVARFKSQEMMDLSYFSHISPVYNKDGFGFDCVITGENLHGGAYLAERVVNGWLNSPGHRAPIMSEDTKSIGIGSVRISGTVTGRGYTTANFGY